MPGAASAARSIPRQWHLWLWSYHLPQTFTHKILVWVFSPVVGAIEIPVCPPKGAAETASDCLQSIESPVIIFCCLFTSGPGIKMQKHHKWRSVEMFLSFFCCQGLDFLMENSSLAEGKHLGGRIWVAVLCFSPGVLEICVWARPGGISAHVPQPVPNLRASFAPYSTSPLPGCIPDTLDKLDGVTQQHLAQQN